MNREQRGNVAGVVTAHGPAEALQGEVDELSAGREEQGHALGLCTSSRADDGRGPHLRRFR